MILCVFTCKTSGGPLNPNKICYCQIQSFYCSPYQIMLSETDVTLKAISGTGLGLDHWVGLGSGRGYDKNTFGAVSNEMSISNF